MKRHEPVSWMTFAVGAAPANPALWSSLFMPRCNSEAAPATRANDLLIPCKMADGQVDSQLETQFGGRD